MTTNPAEPGPGSTGPASSGPPPAQPQTPSKAEQRAHDPLRGSRTGGFYTAVVGLGVVLVLLIIFILQNTEPAQVRMFGWEGSAPLAVLLLIAAVAGILLTALAGSMRLMQLKRRVKRERKA